MTCTAERIVTPAQPGITRGDRAAGAMAQLFQSGAVAVRKHIKRVVFVSGAWSCLAIAAASDAAMAPAADSTYPARPIRIIVPYSPGGGGDIHVRLIGAKLTLAWGQPVVIDNRAGGNTIIGTDLAAKSAPDGYTILLMTNVNTIVDSLYPNLTVL